MIHRQQVLPGESSSQQRHGTSLHSVPFHAKTLPRWLRSHDSRSWQGAYEAPMEHGLDDTPNKVHLDITVCEKSLSLLHSFQRAARCLVFWTWIASCISWRPRLILFRKAVQYQRHMPRIILRGYRSSGDFPSIPFCLTWY